MLKYIFILFSWLLMTVQMEAQQTNPFLELVGKTYGEYHDKYQSLQDSLFDGAGKNHQELLRLLKEAAQYDETGEWELTWQLVAVNIDLFEERNGTYQINGGQLGMDFAGQLLDIAETAREKHFPHLQARALFDAANCYCIYIQNYERAFFVFNKLADLLSTISTYDYPVKPYVYNEIGKLYFNFREYDEAEYYFRLVKDDPALRDNYYNPYFAALHGLGLCYRNNKADYVRSDSCFYAILDTISRDDEQVRRMWSGIIAGCLGVNRYLQGQYDEALPWLLSASQKITRPNDFPYLQEIHTWLADIYLRKEDIAAAGKHISTALDLHAQTLIPEIPPELYSVQSKYMSYTGHPQEATALLDSALVVTSRQNESFSGLVLCKIEQQLREADNQIHRQETSFYRLIVIIICIALIILLSLLIMVAFLYRKKRQAYHELVRQNQKWAGIIVNENAEEEEVGVTLENTSEIEEIDLLIMNSIEKAMNEDELYKRSDLTLDVLVSIIGYKRYHISGVLNRCTGRNFSTYVNEFRVKEVIRLISDPASSSKTVEEIAFDTGFNDRKSLYRIFKKITGLSFSDFRKNMCVK